MAATETSLPYHEPGIVTILIHTSFLLLLNVVNFVLDHSLYCGLLGQVFLGVAWGTPGGKWLGIEAEEVIVQLGYLGLLLLVYEGGLSTSLKALKANLLLSSCVAVTGIGLPMGLSFVLQTLSGATPLQSFAAGAALCSTSLGTTFTVLGSSGLITSRLGVVLTSAAMMDDVVGLVMVQIISNLGGASGANISAVTVVRPLLVSFAFAVCTPLACAFIVKPFTLWLNAHRTKRPMGTVNRLLRKRSTAWLIHTAVLVGLITGSTYAGTSNLFAAYIAGAAISWWDSEVPHTVVDGAATTEATPTPAEGENVASATAEKTQMSHPPSQEPSGPSFSGLDAFEKYYKEPLDRILRPFFFASIGFSIPITEMFSGPIVWKGIVYTILMTIGKLVCGFWLLRISIPASSLTRRLPTLSKLPKLNLAHFWGREETKPAQPAASTTGTSDSSPASDEQQQELDSTPTTTQSPDPSPADIQAAMTETQEGNNRHTSPAGVKPRSIYPATILGCAMTARGEIGFLISSLAESNGVFAAPGSENSGKSSEIFLIVTWAIVLCTILGPLAVGLTVRRVKQLQQGVERQGRVVRGDVLGVWGVS